MYHTVSSVKLFLCSFMKIHMHFSTHMSGSHQLFLLDIQNTRFIHLLHKYVLSIYLGSNTILGVCNGSVNPGRVELTFYYKDIEPNYQK